LTLAVRQLVGATAGDCRPRRTALATAAALQVSPNGLPAYYQAYPLLAGLGIPMTRENVIDP